MDEEIKKDWVAVEVWVSGESLAYLNDTGSTFEEIADLIEVGL